MISAMKQALEALEWADNCPSSLSRIRPAITSLRAAIEQAEKAKPVGEVRPNAVEGYSDVVTMYKEVTAPTKLYTHPAPVPAWQPNWEHAANEGAEKAEPVAEVWRSRNKAAENGMSNGITEMFPMGTNLYIHPAPVPAGLPSEMPEILREAAAILAKEKCMRFPIIDELYGFAAMLAAAPKQGDQRIKELEDGK